MNVQCASLGSTSLMTSRLSVCPAPRTTPPRGREQPPRMSATDARLLKENSGHWPHLATPSLSYTRPLQNSKAATLGVRSTHLLCISVEEMGGPTTTTHLPTTTTPPSSLSSPHSLHLPAVTSTITSYNLKEDFATDKRLKDINSL